MQVNHSEMDFRFDCRDTRLTDVHGKIMRPGVDA
jgi:hypothetical protein